MSDKLSESYPLDLQITLDAIPGQVKGRQCFVSEESQNRAIEAAIDATIDEYLQTLPALFAQFADFKNLLQEKDEELYEAILEKLQIF